MITVKVEGVSINRFESVADFKYYMLADPWRAFKIMADQMQFKYNDEELPRDRYSLDWFNWVDKLNTRGHELKLDGIDNSNIDTFKG